MLAGGRLRNLAVDFALYFWVSSELVLMMNKGFSRSVLERKFSTVTGGINLYLGTLSNTGHEEQTSSSLKHRF